MDDSKLLELAGMAADEKYGPDKNPLERDDLALRLAVKLEIDIWFCANYVLADDVQQPTVNNANDPCAAVRQAIVRAAAEIGQRL